jgi:hypothetical protein
MKAMLAAAVVVAVVVVVFVPLSTHAVAQPATTQAGPGAGAGDVDSLRDHLKTAYAKGDVDGILKFLHPKVVITFPDGSVLQGRQAFVDYYNRMLKGPDHRVQSCTSDPTVTERAVYGDTVVSFGRMNDRYVLTSGEQFGLDSRFTVTALKFPDGPAESGGWMIRSFHSSTDAFDNPVLRMAAKKSAMLGGVGGVIAGFLLGVIAALIIRRRRRTTAAPTT